jgi:GGDEF domain-containing protein
VIPLRTLPGERPARTARPWHPSVPFGSTPPVDLDLIDAGTGARSLRALRRDVAAELAWGSRTEGRPSVVGLVIEPVAIVRERDGDTAAEALLKAVVDVVPFMVRGRDRIYRTGQNELALLMPATDGEGVESALRRLMDQVPLVLAKRKLEGVKLTPRRVRPETLGITATG